MKNINIVNKAVAQKLGMDLKIIEKVNKAYWKEVVRSLTSLENQAVYIKKIGTISVSPYKTNNHIRMLIKKIRKVKASAKYRPTTRQRYLDQYYGDLRRVLVKRNEIATKYYNQRKNQDGAYSRLF